MKKRILLIVLALICLLALSGCGCEHQWIGATCTTPKTCTLCAETEGAPHGHSWLAATCAGPKTCEICGATEGEALAHTWLDATCEEAKTCSVCGTTEGEALGHSWIDATYEAPKTCEACGVTEGEPLEKVETFTQSESYQMVCSVIDENMAEMQPEYSYDDESKIMYIFLTAPEGTAYSIAVTPDEVREVWQTVVTNMSDVSLSSYEAFAADGYSDVSCCIMLLNDTNPENVLLGVLNGVTLYDVMSE